MKNDFISEFVEYLVEEGQTYFLEYGFKLGDTIRFTPSEVGKILKEYFDQQKERGNMIDRNGAIRLISGYKGVVDKSVAKRLLMQMEGISNEENMIDFICKKLNEWFDGPCNYTLGKTDMSDLLVEENWCENVCCNDDNQYRCWKRMFEMLWQESEE